MISCGKVASVLSLVFFLQACGGGGSDSSTPPSNPPVPAPPTSSEIIQDPLNYSVEELASAYDAQIMTDYIGLRSDIELDVVRVQEIYSFIAGPNLLDFFQIRPQDLAEFEDGVTIDDSLQCDFGGSVAINGTYNANQVSTLTVDYQNCDLNPWTESSLDGRSAIKIVTLEDNASEIVVYYENLSLAIEGQSLNILGYIHQIYTESDEQISSTIENHLLVGSSDTGFQFVENSVLNQTNQLIGANNYEAVYRGDFYISDIGHVEFERIESWSQQEDGSYEQIDETQMVGTNQIKLELDENNYVKLLMDDDNDGEYELGAYLGTLYGWQNADLTNIQLVDVDLISIPPEVFAPYFLDNTITTLDTAQVQVGSYFDPDNDEESLTVSYRWYINGELVDNQQSDTFPSGVAVFGDTLAATLVVSDGVNTVESQPATIIIEDSPAVVEVENLPGPINLGDIVSFSARIVDPDLRDDSGTVPVMIAAPNNASIDSTGLVSWDTSGLDTLLPLQNYQFTFAANEESLPETYQSVEITVLSDQDTPIVRSGIEVPLSNYSMWVDDFEGDGTNTVLSTDSNNRVFLLKEQNGVYTQSWMYPYAFPTSGKIQQVLAVNLDDTIKSEILVITQHGVSLIDSLSAPAKPLFHTEEYIQFATAEDSDGDGFVELALLSSNTDYNSSTELLVLSMKDEVSEVARETIPEAHEMLFANVDNDAALELVLNNGLVYDGQTWGNDWFSGTSFGDQLVTAADFDGDGVATIIGADRWGSIIAYSAVDKTQVASFDNFNTCSLNAGDVNGDGTTELLVGDCQWGSITAYSISGSSFTELWNISMQEHGSRSVLLGDSNNDGEPELHWTSGQSHSGENVFLVADITSEGATFIPESRSLQLGTYSAAGWAQKHENAKPSAFFFVPRTRSSYGDSVIAELSDTGEVQLSLPLSSNWDNSFHAAIADIYNDGLEDIIVPTTQTYDGSLSLIRLDSMSVQWEINGDSNDTIGVVQTFDINSDDYNDVVYLSSRSLRAVDVQNQQVIASYTFDHYIQDFAITQSNEDILLAVSSNERTHLLRFTGSGFSEQHFVQRTCTRLDFANVNDSDDKELICLSSENSYADNSQLFIYEVASGELTESFEVIRKNKIKDFVVNTSTENNQSLFVIEGTGDSDGNCYSTCRYQLTEFNSAGSAIWSSPIVLGEPTHRGMRYQYNGASGHQLLLSTDSAMHWINP